MINNELLLKTAFCCIACDGSIAKDEIEALKSFANNLSNFNSINVQELISEYVNAINEKQGAFLNEYLKEVEDSNFDDDSALKLIEIAIKMIEADNVVEYSEIQFFKKIRNCLQISDEILYCKMPDKEDYFLPDIKSSDSNEWIGSINFFTI